MLLAVALSLAAAPAPVQDDGRPRLRLTKDPDAVVLSLDWQGGYGPPRASERPYLEVRADGTLVVPDRTGGDAHLTGRLSPDELKELLLFVERGLRSFDEERAAAHVRAASRGALLLVADAAETVVKVRRRGVELDGRFRALEALAPRHPDIRELQDLLAVSERLRGLMFAVQAGGCERAAELLARVNERLGLEHVGVAPLELEDVYRVDRAEDGTVTVHLSRGGAESGWVAATVVAPREGEPEVRLDVHRPPPPIPGK